MDDKDEEKLVNFPCDNVENCLAIMGLEDQFREWAELEEAAAVAVRKQEEINKNNGGRIKGFIKRLFS